VQLQHNDIDKRVSNHSGWGGNEVYLCSPGPDSILWS
jgi:hypothetical protein